VNCQVSVTKDSKNIRKHSAQVICPLCEESQWEPKLAVSTYCRSCGQHFDIVDGRALSPKKDNGIIVPPQQDDDDLNTSQPPHRLTHGLRKLLRPLSEGIRNRSALRFSNRSHAKLRTVRCLDCAFEHEVSAAATSSLCPACSASASLEDVHLRDDSRRKIKTQGDVFIHKHAALQAGHVACRHLRVEGNLSGKINCSGHATFAANSKIIGSFDCENLLVARKAHVTFLHPVRAASLEIAGEVSGDFFCSGPVKIGPHGAIHGELLAKSLSIDPGGKLDGEFHICRDKEHAQEAAREAEDRFHRDHGDLTNFTNNLFGGGLSPST
jgi:cytoskeletal protein CcmA (bactofilin family)